MTISKENLDIATNLVGEWAWGGTPVHERLIRIIAQALQEKDEEIEIWRKEAMESRIEEREKVSKWLLKNTLATGHGDTIEDLLGEVLWQVREKSFEEAAKIVEGYYWDSLEYEGIGKLYAEGIAALIRNAGKKEG